MKHLLLFLTTIFLVLFLMLYKKDNAVDGSVSRAVNILASSSFVAPWGPGPELKKTFEKQNNLQINFIEIPDLATAIQKLNIEGKDATVDVILGMDQFDISRWASKITWFRLNSPQDNKTFPELNALDSANYFVAYDWAPLTFVARKSEPFAVTKLSDVLGPDFYKQIALQDPRTSSVGLQFLSWVFETKKQDQAILFLKKISQQAHSFSSSWSAAYGLFKNKQTGLVFTYVTSPLYHLKEENDSNYYSVETEEPLPLQVEFAGIPENCKNCEGAQLFMNFLTTIEAQKIIMNKNYMLPIVAQAKEATVFDTLKVFKTLPVKFYEQEVIDRWLKAWTDVTQNQ